MSGTSTADASNVERREQPFLYTWNRRLRHLHGVSLRNLNIDSIDTGSRRKTTSEDDSGLKTSVKKLIRTEAHAIHHARSYDQLAKSADSEDEPLSLSAKTAFHKTAGGVSKRPVRNGLRRRSTLHWATSSPRARQSKLEAVEATRLVTSWFSVHHEDAEQPLYISEVLENSMNPTFSFFDLDTCSATATRSTHFLIRIWSKSELTTEYFVLLEMRVDLRSLQFVGKSLEAFHHPLPENCVLFHLSDGVYTSFTDLPGENMQQPTLTPGMKAMAAAQTATVSTLLKLTNLDDVIQDALSTQSTLEADINRLITDMPQVERALSELSSQRGQTRNTIKAREAEQKAIDFAIKARSDIQTTLNLKRELIQTKASYESELQHSSDQLLSAASTSQKDLDEVADVAMAQTRRICSGLLQIFPIEPIKNRTLQFTIRNIYLPNSAFSDTNSDEIAAALGFTAQLVYQLSLYLSVPLPYTVHPKGSNSFIKDRISAGIAQRQFPLHPTGAAYKFEYGVFLLNKNIEFLMNRSGLRVMDIRHTLPNLKYLMFVLTSGSGEMPGRMAGGIRGLLRAGASPRLSRHNSEDSVTSHSGSALHEKLADGDDTFNGYVRARGLPYRRSMLRDAG